ncbi:MAG: hypothetical protein M1820_010164 [Bogoriella megaspora]|nr:MAG: hypothetical protein M1820_010164 [Bogoriella megaspora]
MQPFVFLSCFLFPQILSAYPVEKRQVGPLSENDINTVQLAHYLELLELNLYSGGCNNFTDAQYSSAAFPNGFRENVCVIAGHEQVHADTLATILQNNGVAPLPPCTYQFPQSVDPTSFVSLANMITSVGIGAYLGGSELINDNPTLEEASGSILTVEARHDAYLRTGLGASPFPTNFDTGLTANWAFNLAQQFIVSCPQQLSGVIQLPKLNVTSPKPPPNLQPPVAPGTTVSFAWDPSTFFVPVDPNAQLYIAMVNQNVSAPIFQSVTSTGTGTGNVQVPQNVNGTAFAALTTFSGGLSLNDLSSFGTLAGPAEVVLS